MNVYCFVFLDTVLASLCKIPRGHTAKRSVLVYPPNPIRMRTLWYFEYN
jgi:hypothetical protein